MKLPVGFKFDAEHDLVALAKGSVEQNRKLGQMAALAGYPVAPNEICYGAMLESIVIGMEAKTQGFNDIRFYSN